MRAKADYRFKVALLCLLTLNSANALAEWQSLGGNEDETAYVDSAVPRDSNRVRMWGLFDLQQPRSFDGKPYLSMKIQREYQCRDKKSRIVAQSVHAGNMGTGELIYRSNVHHKWTVVQADSVEAMLWNIACTSK